MLKAKSDNELVRKMNIFAEVTEARSECLQEVFETKIVEFCNGFDLKKIVREQPPGFTVLFDRTDDTLVGL